MAEEFEKVLGVDNGNPPDSLHQMYPKVNRNFDRVKNWFSSVLALINGHIQSATAHTAQSITYSGEAVGANVKQAIDNTHKRISQIVSQSGDDITELVDARGGYDALVDRLNASDERSADLKQLMIASWHGVDSTIGSADATGALNSLFSAAKAAGKRYIYFDEPHTYNVIGDLTNARDLILIGCGARIKSSNLKNYFIQISNDLSAYNGRFNTFSDTDSLFKTFGLALQKKIVNVTIWGDSISTGGSDVLGIKFNANHTGTTEQSPQGLTQGDSYYLRLIDLLTAKFPDVTFNFYNRAIGGALIQNSEDNQTFNGLTKPWPEHIKDTNPDILIIAFGMNTNLEYAKTHRFCMDRILNYINANYTKKPSICWVTTPRPAMALDDVWGDIDTQLSRNLVAYTARYSGRLKSGYIIDVGRVSDIKRAGVDYINPIMKREDISGLISGTYSENSGVYTFSADGETMVIDVHSSDFTLEFDLSVTGAVDGNGSLWLGYNVYGGSQSVLLFFPLVMGVGAIQNYANFIDNANYSITASKNDTVSWNDGAWRSIRVEKRADILNVYVNGVRFIRDVVATNNLPGNISMIMNGTGSAVYKLQNVKFYEGTFRSFIPSLTEEEMWGQHINGDYNTKSPYGGNGVNHPTTIGIEEVYMPALREFVDDLASIGKQKMLLPSNLLPLEEKITNWQTIAIWPTTTSGANLRYYNAKPTGLPKVASLKKSDGTYLKLRTEINRAEDGIQLLAGEFAVYNEGGFSQILMAYTGTLDATHTFTSYREPSSLN